MKQPTPTAKAEAPRNNQQARREIVLKEFRPDILKTMEIYLRAMDEQELCQTIELATIILNERSG